MHCGEKRKPRIHRQHKRQSAKARLDQLKQLIMAKEYRMPSASMNAAFG
jgi:hypothetical protein